MACVFLNPSHLPAPRLPNSDFGGYGAKQYHFCFSLIDLPVAVGSLPSRYVETPLETADWAPAQGPSLLWILILMLRLVFGFRTLKLIFHHSTRSPYAAARLTPPPLSPTARLSGTGMCTRIFLNAQGFGNVTPPTPHSMRPCAMFFCKRSSTGQGIFPSWTARASPRQSFLNFKLFVGDIAKGLPLGNFLLTPSSPIFSLSFFYPFPSSMPSPGRFWSGCVQCRCRCTSGLPGD